MTHGLLFWHGLGRPCCFAQAWVLLTSCCLCVLFAFHAGINHDKPACTSPSCGIPLHTSLFGGEKDRCACNNFLQRCTECTMLYAQVPTFTANPTTTATLPSTLLELYTVYMPRPAQARF